MEPQKSKFPGPCIVTELYAIIVQSTPDDSNLQGKAKKSSSYREFEVNNQKSGNKQMDGEGMQLSNRVQSTIQGWTLNLNWSDKKVKTKF